MTTTEAPRSPSTPQPSSSSTSIRRALLAAAAAGLLGGCLGLVACDDGETAHPAKRDVDSGWTCTLDDDVVRASGTVTNHSSKTSSYLLEVDFLVDGERVASRSTGIDEVDPGETTREI